MDGTRFRFFSKLVLLCGFCSYAAADTPRNPSVGFILPLTGRAATYGVAAKNGITLALEKHPERFQKIKFIFEDTAYDGKASATTMQKLVDQDRVDALFVWGHGPVEVVAPLAEARHVPLFGVSGDSNIGKGRTYVIRFCTSHEQFAAALLAGLRNRGLRKLGMVKSELAFINATIDRMTRQLDSKESLDVVESFAADANDFKSTIVKLKTLPFDAVGLFLDVDQIETFLRQAEDLNYHPKLFGIHSFGSSAPIAAIKQFSPGAFYPAIAVDLGFEQEYVQRFGNDVQLSWAANAFDFALFIGQLFERASPETSEEFIARVRNAGEIHGVSGKYHPEYDAALGTRMEFPVVLQRIERHEIVRE